MARGLIIVGVILIIAGILLYFIPGIFNWFGKLPGDIRIVKENSKVYFPITSMIIISIVLTIIVNVIRYLGK
ncbi:MAG TPA: DUF2905 domain-containing protein [Mariniphaga sp.]|nr:DUF2905 domain-containing protein [Mariniphaga sp.]